MHGGGLGGQVVCTTCVLSQVVGNCNELGRCPSSPPSTGIHPRPSLLLKVCIAQGEGGRAGGVVRCFPPTPIAVLQHNLLATHHKGPTCRFVKRTRGAMSYVPGWGSRRPPLEAGLLVRNCRGLIAGAGMDGRGLLPLSSAPVILQTLHCAFVATMLTSALSILVGTAPPWCCAVMSAAFRQAHWHYADVTEAWRCVDLPMLG
jgi:hypothetical protein